MSALSLQLPKPTPWTCPGCQQELVSLRGEPAAGSLCAGCSRPEPAPVLDPLEACGVPKKFRSGWDCEDWSRQFGPLPNPVADWDGEASPVLFFGPTGTGKSSLATILMAERVALGKSGLWIRGQALIDGLRGGMGMGSGPEAGAGAEGEGDFRRQSLKAWRRAKAILDGRYPVERAWE